MFKIYVGKNPQNPQNTFFQKRFGLFLKMDIFKMSKMRKSLLDF